MTSSKSLKAQKKPLKKTTKKKTLVKPKEKKILEQNNTVAKPKKASNLKVLPGTSLQVKMKNLTSNNTNNLYSSLKLDSQILNNVEEMQAKYLNSSEQKVQQPLLKGCDILLRTEGVEKTLLLIRAVQIVHQLQMSPKHGLGAVFVVPNPEEAQELLCVLRELMEGMEYKCVMAVNGKDSKNERKKLEKGANILVCTPGKLLHHLETTADLQKRNLQYFVVSNAAEIVDLGLEDNLIKAMQYLPKTRQSVLCTSDCQKTENLTKIVLKTDPLYYDNIEEKEDNDTVDCTLDYLYCASEKRLATLHTMLTRAKSSKVIVYFSTSMSVKYHEDLLNHLDVECYAVHNYFEKRQDNLQVFRDFCNCDTGILLISENCAKSFAMPESHCIIYYDPPQSACSVNDQLVGCTRQIILFLRQHESSFLDLLETESSQITPMQKSSVQGKIENLTAEMYALHQNSQEAYKSYIGQYAANKNKEAFDVNKLDLVKTAQGFGCKVPHFVDLSIKI